MTTEGIKAKDHWSAQHIMLHAAYSSHNNTMLLIPGHTSRCFRPEYYLGHHVVGSGESSLVTILALYNTGQPSWTNKKNDAPGHSSTVALYCTEVSIDNLT